ncbi:hypothetical protein ABZU76_38670 [Amycolatopsis sp. NPDC005232]|uniref:hypothetical protein n=1 Tax=Amycolatopsis sp. NPDC005232 TaxID=3157027 RepID=UPI0033BB6E87
MTRLTAATRGLSAPSRSTTSWLPAARRTRRSAAGDALPSDSAFVSLTDTGRAVLSRLTPQLQD